jgi:CTP synthase (UTP-ammonia lyase)
VRTSRSSNRAHRCTRSTAKTSSPNGIGTATSSTRAFDGQLVEFIELPGHPFWVGTQAHPEFKSRPTRPAPLFRSFIEAVLARSEGRNPHLIDLHELGA